MKNYRLSRFTVLLTVSLPVAGAHSAEHAIAGQWRCQMSYMGDSTDSGMFSFDKSGQCVMGGQTFSCKLLSGNKLQISNGSATDSYTYSVDKDKLKLSYHDGSVFDCTKQSASAAPGGLLQKPAKAQQEKSGNEWQLQGTFCHYSGSSSYGSSYSTTSRISFDGQGHWNMGSESSFSGDAGSAYSGGGVDNSGTYRVTGGRVIYSTSSGEQGVVTVNMQQNDGRITEIYLGQDLYSPSLCN